MELTDIEQVTSAEVSVQDRAALALNATQTEKDLRALAVKNTAIVAVIDKAGRDQAHGAGMELKRARTSIDKLSKEVREDATKFSKAVIAEAARLTAIIEPEEERLLGLRDKWDDEQARIRAQAEAAERARITLIHQRIAAITQYVALANEARDSDRVLVLLGKMEAEWVAAPFEETFEEFCDEAQNAFIHSKARMLEIIEQLQAKEREAAELKAAQQAESARLDAERAALAAERAAAKEEAEKLAAERAAIQVARDMLEKAEADKAAKNSVAEFESDLAAFAQVIAVEPPPEPEVAIEHTEPTDADVMVVAIAALVQTYGWTTQQAVDRLSAISWSQA